jgi:predicted GTPase
MPALQVVSSQPFAGKTTVSVTVARGLAANGARVRLVRHGKGHAAEEDAPTRLSPASPPPLEAKR